MKSPIQLVKAIFNRLYYYCAPDKVYLNHKFRKVFGRDINWKNPTTYNEKLQWLKIYDRNPLYTQFVDKYEVRKYIAEKIGEEYLIPCLGVWDKFEDIDFDALPNKFVLKCTHDSASVVICKDKLTFNRDEARRKLTEHLRRNFYYNAREWPYKYVKPRIIGEKYMEDIETKELRDYKIYCFDGVAKVFFIASERQDLFVETKFDFYDMEFKHLDIKRGHPNAEISPAKPKLFNEMRVLAEKLSQNISHVRVDFYEINGKVYFGELTFFTGSGFVPFEPPKWDEIFGNWICLPKRRKYLCNKVEQKVR